MNRCFICGKEVNENVDFVKLKDNGGNISEMRSIILGAADPVPKYLCKEHLRQTVFTLMITNGLNGMILTEEGL